MALVSAHATTAPPAPSSVDEPSILGLLAAGTVAGVLAWRSRRRR
jgi:MYXO-CTERM domain-containing protein